MFCRNCGNQLTDSSAACAKCGLQPSFQSTPEPDKPKAKSSALGTVILSVLAIGFILAAIGGLSGNNNSNTPAAVTPAKVHKIGEMVTVGVWSYEVMDVHWAKKIGDQWPDAKFLIVKLAAQNNDRTASVLPPLKLVDNDRREYDESSKGIYLEDSFGILKSVNPGVMSLGTAVFDVPEGTYKLQLSGGLESGDSTTVDLQ